MFHSINNSLKQDNKVNLSQAKYKNQDTKWINPKVKAVFIN